MSSHYSIIQYVPNPIADERINFGVLVFDEHSVRTRFLQNWGRVRSFGKPESIDFLKDFADKMEAAAKDGLLFPGEVLGKVPRCERMTKIARDWMNSIQITEPRGSLLGVDELLEDTVKLFLVETKQIDSEQDR